MLIDKGNPVDVEQKKHLESLLVVVELFVIAVVSDNFELICTSAVAVNLLTFWNSEVFLDYLVFVKLLFFIELLPPSSERNPVVRIVFL